MVAVFNEMDFLSLGLSLAGHSEKTTARTKHETNVARFGAKYYASPATCRDIFMDLQLTDIESHLLLALNWLKEYPVGHNFMSSVMSPAKYIFSEIGFAISHAVGGLGILIVNCSC